MKTIKNLAKNYFSTLFFIWLLVAYYGTNEYYSSFLLKDLNISFINWETVINKTYKSFNLYLIIIILYSIFLIPYYYFEKEKSKARIIFTCIYKKIKNKTYKINFSEKTAILSWLVKWFYIPIILIWLTENLFNFITKLTYAITNYNFLQDNFYNYFNAYIFAGIFYLLIFIDTFFFSLWYLLESKFLKNKIKSVDWTLFWWFITLICYPPLNIATWNMLWWYSNNFPKFSNHYLHYFLTISLLLFFAIYARSSVALWLKASNLTNRWIVRKWPYKYVRHPAYISKNISRFIWTLPAYIIAFSTLNFKMIFLISISFFWWASIYFLRAYTEEKHLELDNDYKKYQKEVKYKFIPWIW